MLQATGYCDEILTLKYHVIEVIIRKDLSLKILAKDTLKNREKVV